MATPPKPQDHNTAPALQNKDRFKDQWQRWTLVGLRVVLALILGIFVAQLQLDYLESYLYDLRIRFRPHTSHNQHIQLVLIRPSTVEALRGKPTAAHHAQALEKLAALASDQPYAVVYNMTLPDIEGSLEEKKTWVKTTEGFEHLYAMTDNLVLKGQDQLQPLAPPLEKIRVMSGPKSQDIANFARDGVTRRMLIEYQGRQTIHPYLAAHYNPDVRDMNQIRGLFEVLGAKQVFTNFSPPGSYKPILFEDLLNGRFAPHSFQDKIVLIGQDLNLTEADYATTPYSRQATGMTSAEMHANMFETLIQNSAPRKVPQWLNIFFVCIVSLLTVHVVLTVRPSTGLIILVTTFLGYTLLSYLLLWLFGYWTALIHPLLAIFLAYYFFIPYRLIIENRRSWEYYQRNKLLHQVEELKTNFISMMSHDLKTPIARIQGMLEILVKESSAISPLQREAIDTIKGSSEDLLKFINAILNYAKIESASIKLNLQSKDINHLIDEVVRKHDFLAKVKQIQIIKELEPLFPLQIDPDLIKQVLSNLIENAIKYSPEGTKILITTEDRGGLIQIQVSDQGPGIPADELSNIFMKFFRSKNTKNSPIKGSGLGLYLAKYFTELHHGQISVECTEGQGCTFTVEIPVSQR